MRFNIRKFSVGGPSYSAVPNPFVDDPVVKTSNVDAIKLVPDEVMNSLIKTGIPSDVDKFMAELAQFERDADFGLGVSKSKIYALKAKANRVVQASNYLKEAEKQAQKNGALDEVAVDANGYFFTTDEKGKISKTRMKDFDGSKMMALTVGQLLESRKYSPQLADNTNIATVVGSSVGIEKINSYIKEIINTIGSSSNVSEAYVDLATMTGKDQAKRPTEAQYQAIQGIMNEWNQLGPNAIFKDTEKLKSKNVKDAFNYILSVLPDNMRNQLYGRFVAAGGDVKDAQKHAEQIIATALNMGNDLEQESKFKYDKETTGLVNPKTATSGTRNLNVLEQLVQGSLGKRDYNLTSTKDPNLSMTLHGTGIGALADFKNNAIPQVPLSVAIGKALGPIIDQNHISIGSQKIHPSAFDSIVYNGQDVINIWAPVDANGDVDLERLSQFNSLLDYIKESSDLTEADKIQLLNEYGFSGSFDSNGNFVGDGRNMGQFLVFTGVTSDEIVDDATNPFLEKLTGDEKDWQMEQINRIYGLTNKGIKSKDAQMKFQKGWFDFSTDLYYAPIFMKLNPTAQTDVGAFSGEGALVKTPTYNEQMNYDQARYNKTQHTIQKPSTALMFQ